MLTGNETREAWKIAKEAPGSPKANYKKAVAIVRAKREEPVTIQGYEFKYKMSMRFCKYEGGLVECQVADFDKALNCVCCARKVCHVVHTNKGPMGRECLKKSLGISQKQLSKKIVELEEKERIEKFLEEQALSFVKPTLKEANKVFANRFRFAGEKALKRSYLVETNKGFVRLSIDRENFKYIKKNLEIIEIIDGWGVLGKEKKCS